MFRVLEIFLLLTAELGAERRPYQQNYPQNYQQQPKRQRPYARQPQYQRQRQNPYAQPYSHPKRKPFAQGAGKPSPQQPFAKPQQQIQQQAAPAATANPYAQQQLPAADESSAVMNLEERVTRLETDLDIIKRQSRLLIGSTTVGFLDAMYLKAGLSVILPRAATFISRTDTGFGLFAGIGKYLGRNHVLDAAIEWDFHPAAAFRYRYEFHSASPNITFGPVVGVRYKILDISPFDNFIIDEDEPNSFFLFFGGAIGFPLGTSLIQLELLYNTNSQKFINLNGGIHFFF